MTASLTEACHHLGVPGDATARYSYPNALNVCYAQQAAVSSFLPVELLHQGRFCLTQDHVLCPIYLRQAASVYRESRPGKPVTFLDFFGLSEEPFSIVPQPHFLSESGRQQEALAGLRWLIDQRQGLGLLFGAVGSGKTLLCRTLFDRLSFDPRYITALLLTPNHRSEYAMMADILAAWKVKLQRARSLQDLEMGAHQFLAQAVLERGQTPVLIIDEAQTLPRRHLQQICKLLNWQDGGVQLAQIILAGQSDLHGALLRVPALRDRAVVEFNLGPMTREDVERLISGRLRRAGGRADLFSGSAVSLIFQQSGGMPRRVTILCLLSLWLAFQQGKRFVSREIVQTVVNRIVTAGILAESKDMEAIARAWSELESRPSFPLPARVMDWVRTRLAS
jgi:type II secretory pathway predicted ATPase ExeA